MFFFPLVLVFGFEQSFYAQARPLHLILPRTGCDVISEKRSRKIFDPQFLITLLLAIFSLTR